MSLPIWLDVTAMAISGGFGAAVARNRHVPLIGVLMAGVLVGLGGGMIRDVLLGLEAASIAYWYYIPVVVATSAIGGFVAHRLLQPRVPYLLMQGVALGLLVTIGTQKALDFDAPAISAMFLGVVTATMGGALADVFAGQRATIMSQAHYLLTAVVCGAIVFWAMTSAVDFYAATVATVVVVTLLRVVSVSRGWECPEFRDAPPGPALPGRAGRPARRATSR